MTFIDTQIISYAFKHHKSVSVDGGRIASVVANEFLEVYEKKLTRASYYIPRSNTIFAYSGKLMSSLENIRKHFKNHPFPKRITDRLIIDFNNDYPSVVEFGSFAVSELINSKNEKLFSTAIQTLDKRKQKKLKKRMSFLLENDITCTPLKQKSVEVGLQLLSDFTRKHNLKDDFRNSLNDILILAVAIDEKAHLLTEDSLLNKFAADSKGIEFYSINGNIELDFSEEKANSLCINRESKRYINRRWSVMERRNKPKL